MSQNFVHDDSGVVPYINLFDAHSWHLAIGINGGLEKKKTKEETYLCDHYPPKRIGY